MVVELLLLKRENVNNLIEGRKEGKGGAREEDADRQREDVNDNLIPKSNSLENRIISLTFQG